MTASTTPGHTASTGVSHAGVTWHHLRVSGHRSHRGWVVDSVAGREESVGLVSWTVEAVDIVEHDRARHGTRVETWTRGDNVMRRMVTRVSYSIPRSTMQQQL